MPTSTTDKGRGDNPACRSVVANDATHRVPSRSANSWAKDHRDGEMRTLPFRTMSIPIVPDRRPAAVAHTRPAFARRTVRHVAVVCGERGRVATRRALESLGLRARLAHDDRSTRVRGWYGDVSVVQSRRHSSGTPLVRWFRARWRAGERASRCRTKLPGRAGVQVLHWLRACRRLSAGNENDLHVVPESAGSCRRNHRRRADRWQGGTVSRSRDSRRRRNPGRPLREHRRRRGVLACHTVVFRRTISISAATVLVVSRRDGVRGASMEARNRWVSRTHVRAI